MGMKEIAIAILNPEYEVFIVYVIDIGDKVYPLKKVQIAYLKVKKAPIKVSSKYVDFAIVFSLKLTTKLFEYMGINNYATELIDD